MFLIVGGSSDIGNNLASKLSNYDDVLVTYRNAGNLKKIIPKKNKIYYRKLNLNKLLNIKNFIKKNSKLLKNIKYINLANLTVDKIVANIDIKDVENVYKVNVYSNIIFSKFLIPKMIKDNYGRFIFFTSTRAHRGDIGISLYSSSKHSGLPRCDIIVIEDPWWIQWRIVFKLFLIR